MNRTERLYAIVVPVPGGAAVVPDRSQRSSAPDRRARTEHDAATVFGMPNDDVRPVTLR